MAKNNPIPKPSDVPKPTPAPVLEALGALVGAWSVEGAHVMIPNTVLRGKTTFEWLNGNRFLIQRTTTDHPDVPDSISIIGANDDGALLAMHYFDSRGVMRVYQMKLSNGGWTFWREAPGFWQRSRATFSEDGKTITESIEKSSDGVDWEHDMSKTYTKLD